MRRYSEVARRYASALFQLSEETSNHNKVFADIRALNETFQKDAEIAEFITSPLIQPGDREKALEEALAQGDVSEEVKKVVLLLAKKGRLGIFEDLVLAFQDKADQANGVTRGTVRSAYALSPEERKNIEDIVKQATGKNVILTYTEDPTIIGGLVAQVGSFTFDDTIDSHLRRMKEDLNRRAH